MSSRSRDRGPKKGAWSDGTNVELSDEEVQRFDALPGLISIQQVTHPVGIRAKRVAPDEIATDFVSRSLVFTPHAALCEQSHQSNTAFRDNKCRESGSTAEQIAETMFDVATDESDCITFVAGERAKSTYAQRLAVGIDAFHERAERLLG